MLNKDLLKDSFGQRYKLVTTQDPIIRAPIKPMVFWDRLQAQTFLQQCSIPYNFWNRILADFETSIAAIATQDIETFIADLLVAEKFRLFPLNEADICLAIPEKLTITTGDRTRYSFNHSNRLLNTTPNDVLQFSDVKQAREFLNELALPDDKITEIVQQLELSADSDQTDNMDLSIQDKFAQHLASGLAIVIKTAASLPSVSELETVAATNSVGNRAADLGPHETDPDEEKLKDITIELEDEFERSLSQHFSLFNGLEFILKTDMGEEHQGTIENGKIEIQQARMGSSFELEIKDLPAYLEN